MAAMSTAVMALQVGGVLNSAVGARASAKAQQQALQAQAQLDSINARASASALDAQADLDSINAKAVYDATTSQTKLARTAAQTDALEIRTAAEIESIRAGAATASMEADATMADQSAQLLELQAQSALLLGEREEQQSRLQFAQVKSKQTATMAGRGLDLGEGTPLAVLTSTDLMSENSAIGIQQRALLAALGYRTQAGRTSVAAADRRFQAAMTAASARLNTDLSEIRADAVVANINAAADAQEALAAAGLANAEAAVDMKRVNAETFRINSAAANRVRVAQADGINPSSAFNTTLLAGAGQVAGSWYQYAKTTGGK